MTNKQKNYKRWNLVVAALTCLAATVVAVPLVVDMDGWRFFVGLSAFLFVAALGLWSAKNYQNKPSIFLPIVFFTAGLLIGAVYFLSLCITPAISAFATGAIFAIFSMQKSIDDLLGFPDSNY